MKNEETVLQKVVQYQEVDFCGTYKIANLLSTLSDLATQNAIEIGIWKEELAKKYGWILIKQTIKMKRPIRLGEEIHMSTRAGKSSKIQFVRQYDIYTQDKEVIGGVYSVWALIDIESRSIERPDKLSIKIPIIEEYPHYVEKYERMETIETTYIMTRQVLYSDLDINHHMNNCRYIEWAIDTLDYQVFKEYYISKMSMHFKKEITANTKIRIYYGKEGHCFKVVMKSEDDQIIHFELAGELSLLKQ